MARQNSSAPASVTSADQLREILGEVSERARTKVRTELGRIDRLWLAASPFCLIATSNSRGCCDVSPRGDPPGFTFVIDDTTIVIPERPGNRRADSFHNILENGHAGLIFFVPGRGDTLRINGRAHLVHDAPYFDQLVVKGHRPVLALVLDIDEVFFHCSRALLRSNLWEEDSWQPDAVPSRAQIALDMETTQASLEELEIHYGEKYREGLYR